MTAQGSDNWADAPDITPGVTAPTPNATLTLETGEGSLGVGRTAWWKITPTADGRYRLDTHRTSPTSDADTWLAAYTGTSLGTLTRLVLGHRSGTVNTSERDLDVTAGTTYYIQVDAGTSAPLDYVLTVTALARHTQTLTFGSPIPAGIYPPNSSTERFLGPTLIEPETCTDLIEANTSTNAADALATDDTATYVTARQSDFDDDMDERFPPDPTNIAAYTLTTMGRQDEPFALPTNLVGTLLATVTATVRTTRQGGATATAFWSDLDPLTSFSVSANLTATETVDTGWKRLTAPGTVALADPIRAAAADRYTELHLRLTGGEDAGDGNDDFLGVDILDEVAYLAVELIWYTLPTRRAIIPPCHLYPRSAIENITVYPPASSRQRSNRTNGPY